MNREIKFRGKRKDGNEWLYGDLNHIDGDIYIFDRSDNAPLNSPDWFEVIPETVGQFTGMKDKNGKDIYEGDIIIYEGSKLGHFVEYHAPEFMRHTIMHKEKNQLLPFKSHHKYEITGNIYSSPELLK